MATKHGRSKHYSLPPRASSRPRSRSRMSADTHAPTISTVGTSFESPYQMMDIVVSVDIMEGLIMEMKDRHISSQGSYKLNSNSHSVLGSLPITTFVSCKKNVSSTRTIATHVPSLPLGKPTSSRGGKHHHFLVRWPADFDPHGDALSTFKLSRLMKKESSSNHGLPYGFGYVPEEVELTIGLMRGSEMLTLGLANLVITGEETEEMIIDLPINITKGAVLDAKNKRRSASPLRMLRSPSKSSMKMMKPTAFPSDPKRKYKLSEQSMIRLQVQITPKGQNNSTFEDIETPTAQAADHSDYSPPDDYKSRHSFQSSYVEAGSTRVAPMDELRDDLDTQPRPKESGRARIFGKEIPQLTQDYICGQSDCVATRENDYDYDIDKSTTYDVRVPQMSQSRDPYADEMTQTFDQRSRDVIVYDDPLPPRNREVPPSIPRSSSRPRSISRNRSRLQDPNIYPNSMLYDRNRGSMLDHDDLSRNSDQLALATYKVPDENKQPPGATNWFYDNTAGHGKDGQSKVSKGKMARNNRTRPGSRDIPPLPGNYSITSQRMMPDNHVPPRSHSFDSGENYYNRGQYYDMGGDAQINSLSRRVPSMR